MQSAAEEILELLSRKEYMTASEMAEQLKISTKTVRTRVKEISAEGKKFGIEIQSKPHYGYMLVEIKQDGVKQFLASLDKQRPQLPDTTEERTKYLLAYLINYDGYIKLDELSEFLCVARTTLQNSVKQAEDILNSYHIALERRPNYGIRAVGKEFDFRRCLGECFVKRNPLELQGGTSQEDKIKWLAEMVLPILTEEKIKISETGLENLLVQMNVAIDRIKHGRSISFEEKTEYRKQEHIHEVAKRLAGQIGKSKKVEFSEDEIYYIEVYLAGRRMIGDIGENANNFVIREEIDSLVMRMLELIYREFHIEFRNNFDLRMNLNQHMVPFDIRVRYDIPAHNPVLQEIKQNYVFAYTIALRCSSVLAEHYNKKISEDEIGYLALIFALGLEQTDRMIEKRSILIVCGSGKSSARLLMYKYKKLFADYIEKIYVCSLHELNTFDFSKVDCIFATVPVDQKVPLPVVEIGEFLGADDVEKVKGVLESGQMDYLDKYYKPNQFFTEIEGKNKEEVIRNICEEIAKQRTLPEGFVEAVLKREELAPTAFGNQIAMPHPYKTMTEETFVYVAVLKEEVSWNGHQVRLLFFTAISDEEDATLSKFYETTTNLFLQKEMIQRIIDEKSFSVLMQMLRQTNYNVENGNE